MVEPSMGNTSSTLEPVDVSTKQRRIAELARRHRQRVFISVNHYLDYQWLYQAYVRTRKDGAPGIDGVTARAYQRNLRENLERLLERLKSGRYRAPAVRRAYIAKDDGTQRPLGIPTFEDKVAQRAIVMLLEAIYEQDFLGCSYGFRPGRSAHQALGRLWNDIMVRNGRWILDLDISNYFGSIDHKLLRAALDKRIRDGLVRKLIDKWLKAGVLESGNRIVSRQGTPQGGVVSPLLANIFLHYVLDEWFVKEVMPRMRGRCSMVRFADDAVFVFEYRDDCLRLRTVIEKRLTKYGLKLHPSKTRVVDFGHERDGDSDRDKHNGGAFDFLGFTHIWKRSRRGKWIVMRKTSKQRLARCLRGVYHYCRRHRHDPLAGQHAYLGRLMRGHFAYYGIVGNGSSIRKFAYQVNRIWYKWLKRRNGLGRLRWEKFNRLLKRFPLPPPRIVERYA